MCIDAQMDAQHTVQQTWPSTHGPARSVQAPYVIDSLLHRGAEDAGADEDLQLSHHDRVASCLPQQYVARPRVLPQLIDKGLDAWIL